MACIYAKYPVGYQTAYFGVKAHGHPKGGYHLSVREAQICKEPGWTLEAYHGLDRASNHPQDIHSNIKVIQILSVNS